MQTASAGKSETAESPARASSLTGAAGDSRADRTKNHTHTTPKKKNEKNRISSRPFGGRAGGGGGAKTQPERGVRLLEALAQCTGMC